MNSDVYYNVLVQNINPNKEFASIHRAVMSKQFSDECIKEFTVEGDTVLDPFMGMGTTGVSCKEQKRNFNQPLIAECLRTYTLLNTPQEQILM